MNLIVKATKKLNGTALVPSSKSHSVRALLLATITAGTSELENVLEADDTKIARAVCAALGAKLVARERAGQTGGLDITVTSTGRPLSSAAEIFTASSGITTRFVLPLLGLRGNSSSPVWLDCGAQMRSRPIESFLKTLRDLGMEIQTTPGTVYPLKISGQLQGGTAAVDGVTSQYLSALLLALPLAPNDSVIMVENLNERPYTKMTARWLDGQGITYTWERDGAREVIKIPGRQQYRSFKKVIPGDFSSASYLIAAGALGEGEVRLKGLDFNDPQGDKRLVEILKTMGADITEKNNELVVSGGKKLTGLTIDCNDIPDMVPTLAVVATAASGKTELVNVPQARLKETDRLRSMAEGLKALGARAEEKPDGLVIYESRLCGARVHGYSDHRTVMALALAGLIATGETSIDTAESINKTFPQFVRLMRSLGAGLKLI